MDRGWLRCVWGFVWRELQLTPRRGNLIFYLEEMLAFLYGHKTSDSSFFVTYLVKFRCFDSSLRKKGWRPTNPIWEFGIHLGKILSWEAERQKLTGFQTVCLPFAVGLRAQACHWRNEPCWPSHWNQPPRDSSPFFSSRPAWFSVTETYPAVFLCRRLTSSHVSIASIFLLLHNSPSFSLPIQSSLCLSGMPFPVSSSARHPPTHFQQTPVSPLWAPFNCSPHLFSTRAPF